MINLINFLVFENTLLAFGEAGVKNQIGKIAASQYPKEEQKIKLALSSLDKKSASLFIFLNYEYKLRKAR
jgi:hypothetical protein